MMHETKLASILSTLLATAALGACGAGPEPTPEPVDPTDPIADTDAPVIPDEPTDPADDSVIVPPPASDLLVVLELDRLQGMPALETEQTIDGAVRSLSAIYAPADITLLVEHDDDDLPNPGALTLGDLHGLMTANRDSQLQGDLHLYGLIATERLGNPNTLGVMFDFGANDENGIPREAFAIFASAHDGFGARKAGEMLLTTAHEMAHCFNLHHNDWEGQGFKQDATIESYCMTDTVRWSLSAQSLAHLARDPVTHPERLVLWGANSLPFTFITETHAAGHQDVPFGNYQIIERQDVGRASRRIDFGEEAATKQRIQGVSREASRSSAIDGLRLELRQNKSRWAVGEAIVLEAALLNGGSENQTVSTLLDPTLGFLTISIRRSGEEAVSYVPPVHENARGSRLVTLAPSEEIAEPCRIFFGAGGWTFTEPGVYHVTAGFHDITPAGARWFESNELEVLIASPDSEASRAVERLSLDAETGLLLYMQNGDHLTGAVSRLRKVAQDFAGQPQAAAARLTLGMCALRPSVDPTTKARPGVRLDEALHFLEGVLDTDLPAQSLIQSQRVLAEELERAGHTEKAVDVRVQTIQKYWQGAELLEAETLKEIDLERILETDQVQQVRGRTESEYRKIRNE